MTEDQHTQKATRRCLEMGGPGPHPRGFEWAQQTQSPHSHPVSTAGVPAPGEGGQRLAYLVRSAPGRRPRPDGESAGTGGPSGGCSGRGDGRGAASSAGGGGAGGCMVGGAQDAFLPAEEPLRATHEVSMTLTPMLAGTQRHPGLPPRAGCRAHPPSKRSSSAAPSISWAREARWRPCSAVPASWRLRAGLPTSFPRIQASLRSRVGLPGGGREGALLPNGRWRRAGQRRGRSISLEQGADPQGASKHPSASFRSPGGVWGTGPTPGSRASPRLLAELSLCGVYAAGKGLIMPPVTPGPRCPLNEGNTALSKLAKQPDTHIHPLAALAKAQPA